VRVAAAAFVAASIFLGGVLVGAGTRGERQVDAPVAIELVDRERLSDDPQGQGSGGSVPREVKRGEAGDDDNDGEYEYEYEGSDDYDDDDSDDDSGSGSDDSGSESDDSGSESDDSGSGSDNSGSGSDDSGGHD
jgi:hypothetical protein